MEEECTGLESLRKRSNDKSKQTRKRRWWVIFETGNIPAHALRVAVWLQTFLSFEQEGNESSASRHCSITLEKTPWLWTWERKWEGVVDLENRYASFALLGIETRCLFCPSLSYTDYNIQAIDFPVVSSIIKMGYNFC